MIRAGIAVAVAWLVGLTALWLLAQDADARRRRPHGARPVPIAQAIDVGPTVVRTIRIDPCEVTRTFVEMWRCRAL